MYNEFDKFQIFRFKKIGENGFSTNIYYDSKKVGVATRDDGKVSLEDISVKLTKKAKEHLKETLKRRRKIKVDGQYVNWSAELFVFCLIENYHNFQKIKKITDQGKIVIKLENEDFFRVLNIPNNPSNVTLVKKNYENIEMFGTEFLDHYNSVMKESAENTEDESSVNEEDFYSKENELQDDENEKLELD